MKSWVANLNTTSFRIAMSVITSSILCAVVTAAIVFLNWLPSGPQITVLGGVMLMQLTMMGFDVLQYWGQRKTDIGYVTAKQGTPQNINVTADLPIPVTQVPAAAPVAMSAPTQPPPAASSPGRLNVPFPVLTDRIETAGPWRGIPDDVTTAPPRVSSPAAIGAAVPGEGG